MYTIYKLYSLPLILHANNAIVRKNNKDIKSLSLYIYIYIYIYLYLFIICLYVLQSCGINNMSRSIVLWTTSYGTRPPVHIYIYMYMYIILPQTSNSERRKGIFYSAKRPARSDTNPPPYVMGTLISSPGGGGGKAAAA